MKSWTERVARYMGIVDYLAILLGVTTLVLTIFGCECKWLIWSAGLVCLLYIFYGFYLLVLCRPKFDWHLLHGHFLRKVVVFVLLMPSFVASLFLLYNSIFDEYSTKNLVYAEELYECDGKVDTLCVANDELLANPLFLKAHNLSLQGDSIVVQNHKLANDEVGKRQKPSMHWSVLYHFVDPGNQDMATSQSGRGWAAIIAMLGVFLLNGLLVSSIIGWFESRKEKWLKGAVKYPWFLFLSRKKHYVIIGGNDMASGIVKKIFSEPKTSGTPYVIIQTSRDIETFRRELFSDLTINQQQHVLIFYGCRTSKEELAELRLHKASEIYIIGEQTRTDELEPYHDTLSMQSFDLIADMLKGDLRCEETIRCYVMFEYQTSFAAFQSSNQCRAIYSGVKDQPSYREVLFIPFSPYETWAQKILIRGNAESLDNDVITYNKIDGDSIPYESDKRVHLIVVGMSKMGTAMAMEAAHLAHFPNFVRDKSKRTKITFIDKNAKEESDFFMGRFPDLFKLCKWTDVDGVVHNNTAPECKEYNYFRENFLDIEWEFRNGGVESKENRDYITSCFDSGRNEIVTIAVCLPWPHQSLAAALYLPKIALEKANDIWVYQPQNETLILDINKRDGVGNESWNLTTYNKLKPFGMLNSGFDAELLDNAAIQYCEKFYKVPDVLQNECEQNHNGENVCCWNEWDRAKVEAEVVKIPLGFGKLWGIWSNIYQLDTIGFKLRSLGGDESKLDDPETKIVFAEVEHNRWNVEKLLMGYRPFANHKLDASELVELKAYLKEKEVGDSDLAKLQDGVNQKDLYDGLKNQGLGILAAKVKKFYKEGPMKIHANITPFERLSLADKNYDICFTLAMPFLKRKLDEAGKKNKKDKND